MGPYIDENGTFVIEENGTRMELRKNGKILIVTSDEVLRRDLEHWKYDEAGRIYYD